MERRGASVIRSIRLDAGDIVGTVVDPESDVVAFKGVPYAAPPVGVLRWRPPQPPNVWDGQRPCTEFGPACPQPPGFFAEAPIDETPRRQGEDCLYLNVWTAATDSADTRPVLVWLHGGAFVNGWGHQRDSDGTALARKGVVVVSLNYRLGPFGFLAHPSLTAESDRDASGNYGLLDQIAALRWVQANIGAFGGDPECVTVFGQSAGGFSVNLLRVSPLAAGLFHRAVCQSAPGGTALGPPLAVAEAQGERFAETVLGERAGRPALEALRAVPAQALAGAATSTASLTDRISGAAEPDFGFGPVTDDWVLCPGRQAWDVPLILGVNADEGSYWAELEGLAGFVDNVAGYRAFVEWRGGERGAGLLALYPAARTEDVRDAFVRYFGDTTFVRDTRVVARSMDDLRSDAWLYCFAYRGGGDAIPGAYHGKEIRYVFNNPGAECTPADAALADVMSSLLVRFAATGDPSGPGLPAWPVYDTGTDRYLELGETVRVGTGLRKRHCDALDRLMASGAV